MLLSSTIRNTPEGNRYFPIIDSVVLPLQFDSADELKASINAMMKDDIPMLLALTEEAIEDMEYQLTSAIYPHVERRIAFARALAVRLSGMIRRVA
jgi:hypothetical protein